LRFLSSLLILILGIQTYSMAQTSGAYPQPSVPPKTRPAPDEYGAGPQAAVQAATGAVVIGGTISVIAIGAAVVAAKNSGGVSSTSSTSTSSK
jgi:hypothetical protein